MKGTLLTALLGFTICLLAVDLFICAANAQTTDSLNVTYGGTSGSSAALVHTAIPLPNGKILVGGSSIRFLSSGNQWHTNLVRLNSDGSVDDSFGTSIAGARPSDAVGLECIALQTNGQILVGGTFTKINGEGHYSIGRLNTDGTVDTQFGASVNNYVYCLLVQPDGKILIGGSFTSVSGQSCSGLCRLNYDGSRDTNFNAGANNSIMSLALQPDGQIVVEGKFTSIGGQPRTSLARLNADGSLDSSFQLVTFGTSGTLIGGFGGALAVQPDGKILVGAMFSRVNGLSHTNIVRFNSDGTLDTDFNAQTDQYGSWGLQTLTLQTDGKILVGDDSLTLNSQPCPRLGRLNADGSLDAGFKTNLIGSGTMVFSSTVQPDGRILTAGWFSILGGLTRPGLGRLINTDNATQHLSYDGTNVLWLRGGTSPELWRTSFEASTNGTDWTYLGDGLRVSGGWQLSNVSASADATIRARGFAAGGRSAGSSWFMESVYPQAAPAIVMNDGNLGLRSNQFGFNLIGSAGSTVVIDASGTLLDWSPIATNMLPSGPLYFTDPASTNSPHSFYRARLQQ
jgi:uncharacterized delta-60 repeat protein